MTDEIKPVAWRSRLLDPETQKPISQWEHRDYEPKRDRSLRDYEVQPLYTTPPTQPLAEGADAEKLRSAVEASGFLLDRLDDLEQDVNERDFYGHVSPAASRLRQALAVLQQEGC